MQRILIQAGLDQLGPDQIKVRKKAVRLKDKDELPLVLICPGTERLYHQTMGSKDHLGYPVYVVVVREGAYQFEDLDWQFAIREQVRQRLRVTTLAEASGVFDQAGYDPEPVFDLSSLDAGFDVSVQMFVYKASEARNG